MTAGPGREEPVRSGTLYSDLGIYRTSSSFFEKFPCISAGKRKTPAEGRWEARQISELLVQIILGGSPQHIEIIRKKRGMEIALKRATIA
jgi:hypothetical protein